MAGTGTTRARTTFLAALAASATVLAQLTGCDGGSDEPAQASGSRPSSSSSSHSTETSPTATTPPTGTTVAPPPPTTTPAPAPPPAVPAPLRGQDVTVIPTARPVVALTFDAGANSAGLPSILATLRNQGVSATFFLTGRWAAGNPAQVRAIRSAGHRIGNHSMDHPQFTRLSAAHIGEQLTGAQRAIQAAGADPRPLFRFPFGDRDARTIATVNDLGYVPVRWTVDTLGWKGTSGGMSAQQVTDRAVAALRPGAILLMHVGSHPEDGSILDADALPEVIARMRAAGYAFVTLDLLLAH